MILKHETTNIVVKPLPNFEVRGEIDEIEYIGKSNRVKEIFCKKNLLRGQLMDRNTSTTYESTY